MRQLASTLARSYALLICVSVASIPTAGLSSTSVDDLLPASDKPSEAVLKCAESAAGWWQNQYWMGWDYLDSADAVALCGKALSEEPDNMDVAAFLARALVKAGDYSEAMKYATASANQGNAIGLWQVGVMHENGYGIAKNQSQANSWYLRSAEQGYISAQVRLAEAYSLGDGVDKDHERAIYWLRQAMTNTNESKFMAGFQEWSAKILAEIFVNSKTQPVHANEAYLAAHHIYYLDTLDEESIADASRRFDRARELYAFAGNLGHELAQLNLAEVYFFGIGTAVNLVEARKWYGLAADQGNTTARIRLDSLDR